MKRQILIFSFAIFTYLSAYAGIPDSIVLNDGWSFRQPGNRWFPATVPGTLHTDLLANKLINDPFLGDNESKLQWVEENNWEYRCDFDCPGNITNHKNIILVFKGLDTYASVFLNKKLILETANMFREYEVDVKPHLRKTGNQLVILFSSASRRGKELAKLLPYTLPGDEKVFTRKAQYHYGWDWGPRFVTTGIFRPVIIKAWNDAVLQPVALQQISQSASNARFMAIITVNASTSGKYLIRLSGSPGENISKSMEIELSQGISTHRIDFNIPDPQLWWCNGLGQPFLYTIKISLLKDTILCDESTIRTGVRTLELVKEKDEKGESFYFRLNGINVFMKGANYIPPDNFLPRVTHAKYDSIINLVANTNMNMLRIWGGGTYENDYFYDLCDEKGILIWQDFMFACAMYPGDTAFLNNVESEVRYNVERLRNHPCIALWCGNNEIDEGWHNWGWQKQYNYSPADSAEIWENYKTVFHKIIPFVLSELDPQRPYQPSSPLIGWGHSESLLSGDSHYWGIWWGMEPFENYELKTGRFMSEYGFQGFPDPATINAFTNPSDRKLSSSVMKSHQKHSAGFETIQKYMERDFPVPGDFDKYNYVSQLLQAYGMGKAIEAHRRAMPYCMGTLFWQLNDCWPVVSWSATDYYLRPKAFYYSLQRTFAPVLISACKENDSTVVYLISDKPRNIKGNLNIQLLDFRGNILFEKEIKDIIINNESRKLFEMQEKQLLSGHDPAKLFMYATFKYNNNMIADMFYYFTKPAKLKLKKADYQLKFTTESGNNYIEITANTLLKNVRITSPDQYLRLEDNYFDLLPEHTKKILLPGNTDLNKLKQYINIMTLNDI